MSNGRRLVAAMAEAYQSVILTNPVDIPNLPGVLQPKHQIRLCRQIVEQAEVVPITRLHRWLGFLQGALLATGAVNLDGLNAISRRVRQAHQADSQDRENLSDHLDLTSSFELDIGGEA